MKTTVTIYGHSNDLIEIEGGICEEFTASTRVGGDLIAFSDGTVLRIVYGAGDEAFWRITPVVQGKAKYEKHEATCEDKDYSDRVTLTGDIAWAVCGSALAPDAKRRPARARGGDDKGGT